MIIPTRLLRQMPANSSGAEFLLTISKFKKRMNFVIPCLRPSQNVKLGIFTGSHAVDDKEMYKKAWCTCKVVVLPCHTIANLTFSSPPHLEISIIYDTLWSVKSRIFSGQIDLLLLIACQTFFDSSIVPSFVVYRKESRKIKVFLAGTSLVNEPGKCGETIAVVYELTKRTQQCAQSGAGIRLNFWK